MAATFSVSCKQVSLWQTQAAELPRTTGVPEDLSKVCLLRVRCPQEVRELLEDSVPEGWLEVGSFPWWGPRGWWRQGNVIRCETAVATRCWSLESQCRSDDAPVCEWVGVWERARTWMHGFSCLQGIKSMLKVNLNRNSLTFWEKLFLYLFSVLTDGRSRSYRSSLCVLRVCELRLKQQVKTAGWRLMCHCSLGSSCRHRSCL